MLRASQQPQSQVLELTRDNRAAVFKGDLEKYFKLEMCSWIRSIPTSIIFAKDRFTADDLKLAKMIRSNGKKFSFIRARIDQDVENARRSRQHLFDEDAILEKIRKNCAKA